MNDTPKKPTTLTLGKKLELKKGPGTDQVRQTFSHGRSKTVAVEVKRRRGLDKAQGAESSEDASSDNALLSRFTKDELESRLRAVKEAMKEPLKTLTPANDEKSLDLDDQREESDEDLQSEKGAVEEQTVLEETPTTPSLEKERAQPVPEKNPYKRPASTASQKQPIVLEQRIFKSSEYGPKPVVQKVVKEVPQAPAYTPPPPAKNFDANDEGSSRKKTVRVVEGKKAPSPSRDVVSGARKLTGSALDRALNDEEEKRRSLASMRRARQKHKQHDQNQEATKIVRDVAIPDTILVGELANRMAVRGADVVKALMKMGMMVTINQVIDADTAELVCVELGHTPKRVSDADVEIGLKGVEDAPQNLIFRAPVVTVMGHVDHGKTSLLDALRETDVVAGEAGGITQHIGAYQVTMKSGKKITFIDTPGHAAFTEMRARGANLTDVVVLVVAADDGIMPQTIEAINHAKAANVPMVVAINKVDKPDADPMRVRSDLLQHGVVLEDFGGDVLAIEVSAKKRMNLEKLEEAILLQAEVLDLKANPSRLAEGVVVESRLDRGRGMIATVLVQRGTLREGSIFVAGKEWGKVRALINDHGQKIKEAGPAMPVEVLGFNGLPAAGDELIVVEDESKAKEIAEYRDRRSRELKSAASAKTNMEKMLSQIAAGNTKELAIVIKTDVQGSLEALAASFAKLSTDEVSVRVLHGAVGGINESDVTLARASDGMIIGFNVRANPQARDLAKRDAVDIRYYSIIYNAIDDVKACLGGLLSPELQEKFLGYADIRQVFSVTKFGKIAGCYVTEGMVKRGAKVRLLRDNIVIHEGTLKSLRRFKDEVKEVKNNFECGMAFENYDDIKVGDVIECFEIEKIARVL